MSGGRDSWCYEWFSRGIIRRILRNVVGFRGWRYVMQFLSYGVSGVSLVGLDVKGVLKLFDECRVEKGVAGVFVDSFFVYSFISPRTSIYLFEVKDRIRLRDVVEAVSRSEIGRYVNVLRSSVKIKLKGRPEVVTIYISSDRSVLYLVFLDRGKMSEYIDESGRIHRSFSLLGSVLVLRDGGEYVEVRTSSLRNAEVVLEHAKRLAGLDTNAKHVLFRDVGFAYSMLEAVDTLGYIGLEFFGTQPYGRITYLGKHLGGKRYDLRTVDEVKKRIKEAIESGRITRMHGYIDPEEKNLIPEIKVGNGVVRTSESVSFGVNFLESRIYFFSLVPAAVQDSVVRFIYSVRSGSFGYAKRRTRTLFDYLQR